MARSLIRQLVNAFSPVAILNFITCAICRGYKIDCTALPDCHHSFCRTCIVNHLRNTRRCPIDTCRNPILSIRPFKDLREDRQTQNIIYLLVPGLRLREGRRRREFWDNNPILKEINQSAVSKDMELLEDNAVLLKVSICLKHLETTEPRLSSNANWKEIQSPFGQFYIRLKDNTPIEMLQLLMRKKFEKFKDQCNPDIIQVIFLLHVRGIYMPLHDHATIGDVFCASNVSCLSDVVVYYAVFVPIFYFKNLRPSQQAWHTNGSALPVWSAEKSITASEDEHEREMSDEDRSAAATLKASNGLVPAITAPSAEGLQGTTKSPTMFTTLDNALVEQEMAGNPKKKKRANGHSKEAGSVNPAKKRRRNGTCRQQVEGAREYWFKIGETQLKPSSDAILSNGFVGVGKPHTLGYEGRTDASKQPTTPVAVNSPTTTDVRQDQAEEDNLQPTVATEAEEDMCATMAEKPSGSENGTPQSSTANGPIRRAPDAPKSSASVGTPNRSDRVQRIPEPVNSKASANLRNGLASPLVNIGKSLVTVDIGPSAVARSKDRKITDGSWQRGRGRIYPLLRPKLTPHEEQMTMRRVQPNGKPQAIPPNSESTPKEISVQILSQGNDGSRTPRSVRIPVKTLTTPMVPLATTTVRPVTQRRNAAIHNIGTLGCMTPATNPAMQPPVFSTAPTPRRNAPVQVATALRPGQSYYVSIKPKPGSTIVRTEDLKQRAPASPKDDTPRPYFNNYRAATIVNPSTIPRVKKVLPVTTSPLKLSAPPNSLRTVILPATGTGERRAVTVFTTNVSIAGPINNSKPITISGLQHQQPRRNWQSRPTSANVGLNSAIDTSGEPLAKRKAPNRAPAATTKSRKFGCSVKVPINTATNNRVVRRSQQLRNAQLSRHYVSDPVAVSTGARRQKALPPKQNGNQVVPSVEAVNDDAAADPSYVREVNNDNVITSVYSMKRKDLDSVVPSIEREAGNVLPQIEHEIDSVLPNIERDAGDFFETLPSYIFEDTVERPKPVENRDGLKPFLDYSKMEPIDESADDDFECYLGRKISSFLCSHI